MGQTIALTGMVLAAAPVGDYDRRITVLTKERGKIHAFARGARRQGSQLTAAANPFAFGEFEAYEGRSSYTVVKASISNYFRQLTEDFENVYYGFYFLEIADYYARENTDELPMLKLLYQSLRALESERLHNRLVRRIFELKAMAVNGEWPNVFSCVECGREDALTRFSSERGGALCGACGGGRGLMLDPSALYAMQYVISSDIGKLYTFTVTEEALSCIERILEDYMGRYIDRGFQSLQVLREIKNF